MRTSFHHQPEAQHPKFFSYPQAAGRLPHLSGPMPPHIANQLKASACGTKLTC